MNSTYQDPSKLILCLWSRFTPDMIEERILLAMKAFYNSSILSMLRNTKYLFALLRFDSKGRFVVSVQQLLCIYDRFAEVVGVRRMSVQHVSDIIGEVPGALGKVRIASH